jgi:hypothetical protein
VRVLLDEHLPRKLAAELTGHDARTVRELGWGSLQNGALLRRAVDEGFGAMLTMDQRIPNQQNLAQIGIGIVVLRAANSRLTNLRPLVPNILIELQTIRPGDCRIVGPL